MKRKELESEVGSRRTRIQKYNQQKLETKKNEEYQAITHAIGTIEKEITGIEDRELELMEAADKRSQSSRRRRRKRRRRRRRSPSSLRISMRR